MTMGNSRTGKKVCRRYAVVLLLLGLACVISSAGLAWTTEGVGGGQQDVKVGQTNDACDGSERVRFHGKDGDVFLKAGESKRVEMPSLMNEFYWFCGGSREHVANDDYFNVVRISRAGNGAITWKFYKAAPTPEPGSSGGNGKPDLIKVGTTKDGCDGARDVRFKTKDDSDFKVRAGQSKLVQLSGPTNTINWRCVPPGGNCATDDDCSESSSNIVAFDWVQLDRAGNGALNWVFYRQKNEPTPLAPDVPETPAYAHNATGNLKILVSLPGKQKEIPFDAAFLKNKLDGVWNGKQSIIRDTMKTIITEQGKDAAKKFGASFQLDSLTVSTTNSNELRTAAKDNTLWIKYVAHHNVVNCRFLKGPLEPKFTITFDIQLEMVLPQVRIDGPPQTPKAPMRLAHTEVEGANVFGDAAQEIFKSKLQGVKTSANIISQDFTQEINDFLKSDWPKGPDIPPNLIKSELSVTPAGTVRFCLRTPGAPECQFGATETAHTPAVLDASGDGCGEPLIWIQDAETHRFISVAKGKNALVEVESRSFDFYCGGNQGPESQEFAAGPVGTYFVRVSRNPTGGGIKWKFMSWR